MRYNNENFFENSNDLELFIFIYKSLIILLISIIIFFIINKKSNNYNGLINKTNDSILNKFEHNYKINKFIIIRRNRHGCGMFGYYISFLGCIQLFVSKGYVPIIDLSSLPNIFNGYNITSKSINPWELFFNQPFGYKLSNIKNYVKNTKYFECNLHPSKRPNSYSIFINEIIRYFWNNIANNYMPIKKEIINEAIKIKMKLFNKSNNVLGILIRGTDYLAMKPKNHPKQPDSKIVLKDIKIMNNKNKYDYFFLATEDDIIRDKFIKQLGSILKFIKPIHNIEYNYKNKNFLGFNKYIKGNINYLKNYLLSIIILSQCLDIICSRTAGSTGVFILTKGFRNKKIYYLGIYK